MTRLSRPRRGIAGFENERYSNIKNCEEIKIIKLTINAKYFTQIS